MFLNALQLFFEWLASYLIVLTLIYMWKHADSLSDGNIGYDPDADTIFK